MGQNMLHALSDEYRSGRSGIYQPRFPQPLPDVTRATTMDGYIAVATYIYINKVALLHLKRFQFNG